MTKLSRLVVCEKLMGIEKTKRRNDIKSKTEIHLIFRDQEFGNDTKNVVT